MSRLISLVWVGQAISFLLASVVLFFKPEPSLRLLWGGPTHEPGHGGGFIASEVRMLAPMLFCLALFSAAASMREDERVRRHLAVSFSLVLGACVYLLLSHGDHVTALFNGVAEGHGIAWDIVAGVLALGFLLQAAYAFSPHPEPVAPRMSGTADTKPPRLWSLWVIQGTVFVVVGAALWIAKASMIAALVYNSHVAEAVTHLPAAEFILDFEGATYIGVGLLSFHATTVEREWHWQFYAGIFTMVGATLVMAMLVVYPLMNLLSTPLQLLPALVVMVGNGTYWSRKNDLIAEEIGQGPDGWTLLDIPAGPLLMIQSFFARRRATHPMGVAARGSFHVVDEPEFPPNDFFTAGREMPLQARFAALSSRDDASNDLRGAAIRLSDHVDVASPFDVLMNSGSISGPEEMVTFTLGVFTRFFPQTLFYDAVRKNRQVREGLIAGRRRAPECVTRIHYYTQIVRFWIDTDDVRWLVRYRLLDPTQPESGLATPKEASEIWVRERKKTERRPSNYLRTELKRRLTTGNPIVMRFQAQFHRPQPGDTLDWYNAGVDWPLDDEHRWVDIAKVTLKTPLRDEDAERLSFNAANHPPSLGIPVAAAGMRDFRSLGDSERRVIRRLARLRAWMYRVYGYPTFGNTLPDQNDR